MIGRYLESLTDEQLQRVADATGWETGYLVTPGGDRCLVGHATAVTPDAAAGCGSYGTLVGLGGRWADLAAMRFDGIPSGYYHRGHRHRGRGAVVGLTTLVTMIQNRARRILARRHLERSPIELALVDAHAAQG